MKNFNFNSRAYRVIFGHGTVASLRLELESMKLKRVLVLSTPGHAHMANALIADFGPLAAGAYSHAKMHTPIEVTEHALHTMLDLDIDGLVAVGGGSTIGLSKALALRTHVPQIVVPTTYAGSEMTPLLGETSRGVKKTIVDPQIQPELVIYDVDMTITLPPRTSAVSGMNAIAHAVEALYAKDGNPITALIAVEGLAALSRSLPTIVQNPSDRVARSNALYGAWLCGTCLGAVGVALHHKLCHVLGGSLNLPHAETHAVVLPHALAFNAPAIPHAIRCLQPVLGRDPARGLYDLLGRIGSPRSLREIGMAESAIDQITEQALLNPYWNPRPISREGIKTLLTRAWAGDTPVSWTFDVPDIGDAI